MYFNINKRWCEVHPNIYYRTCKIGEAMNNQYNNNPISDITLFVKMGIVELSILVVVGLAVKLLPNAITVSSVGKIGLGN